MDLFLLFGDSITQQSFSQAKGFAFGAALADAYVRRLDTVNRGLSGYNSSQALQVIDKIIPPPSTARLRFLTIWFGANDSRLPDTPGTSQHVPLADYTSNLRKIMAHPAIGAHKDVRIILITTPPVDERLQEDLDRSNFPNLKGLRRTAESNAAYARAARELAADTGLACLDIWTAMMKRAGWDPASDAPLPGSKKQKPNEVLASFLSDGLHFNPNGYKLLYDELMNLISCKWPDQMPEKLKYVLPAWDDSSAWTE